MKTFERLEQIDFAGELVGAAIPPVEVHHNGALGLELSGAFVALIQKSEFAEGFAPAVTPEINPVGSSGQCAGRDLQSEGLDGAVDFGAVGAGDQAGLGQPGGLALAQRLGAFKPALEQVAGGGGFLGLEEFVVPQGPIDRFVVHLHVGQELELLRALFEFGPQVSDFRKQFGCALLQFFPFLRGDLDAEGGNRADGLGDVVLGAVGEEGLSRKNEERAEGGDFHGLRTGSHPISAKRRPEGKRSGSGVIFRLAPRGPICRFPGACRWISRDS